MLLVEFAECLVWPKNASPQSHHSFWCKIFANQINSMCDGIIDPREEQDQLF